MTKSGTTALRRRSSVQSGLKKPQTELCVSMVRCNIPRTATGSTGFYIRPWWDTGHGTVWFTNSYFKSLRLWFLDDKRLNTLFLIKAENVTLCSFKNDSEICNTFDARDFWWSSVYQVILRYLPHKHTEYKWRGKGLNVWKFKITKEAWQKTIQTKSQNVRLDVEQKTMQHGVKVK